MKGVVSLPIRQFHPGNRCKWIYYKLFNLNITCDSENRQFYMDCENSTSIRINFEYLETGTEYPRYNCALERNETCYSGCLLFEQYSFYMIQEKGNNVTQLAYRDLSSCTKNPNVKLNNDKKMNLCESNSAYYKPFSNYKYLIYLMAMYSMCIYSISL